MKARATLSLAPSCCKLRMPGSISGRGGLGATVQHECQVNVRFFNPPQSLRRYFTTFYLMEVTVPDGGTVTDSLHPEWGNLRLHSGSNPTATTLSGRTLAETSFAVTGPSSGAVRFTIGSTRMWGIGLLPLGWAKFVHARADTLADGLFDGHSSPHFSSFSSLAHGLFGPAPDPVRELDHITAHFLARSEEPVPDEERIVAVHAAMIDPETHTVARFAERAGLSQRTLERICERAFGFRPKLLLRRQRFLRSLAQFMLDPTLKWIGAIDAQYHDQAQFVRDFRQFMGQTPRRYAASVKPILGAVMHARAAFAGRAVQALDGPEGAPLPA